MRTRVLISAFILLITTWALLFVHTRNNGLHSRLTFKRNFAKILFKHKEIELHHASYYLAGIDDNGVYLGNSSHGKEIVALTSDLEFGATTTVPVETSTSMIKIDSGIIQLFDMQNFQFYSGSFPIDRLSGIVRSKVFVTDPVLVNQKMIGRVWYEGGKELVLAKMDSTADSTISQGLLQKKSDGVFCTDGMLHYSESLDMLVYVYFYRNEFFTFDDDMTLLKRSHTIDTTNFAPLSIITSNDGHKKTIASPNAVVNRKSCVKNGKLYINSTAISRDETWSTFLDNSVIDTYDLATCEYEFSFSIPHVNGKAFKNFLVSRKMIYALYDERLVSYTLR